MLTQAYPKQYGPWEGLGEKALDGAGTAALAGPAADAQHRAPSRHRVIVAVPMLPCGLAASQHSASKPRLAVVLLSMGTLFLTFGMCYLIRDTSL